MRRAHCRRRKASWTHWIPFTSFPTYRLLDETMRGELRVLLAREARRWVEEDVSAGRTAKVHLALARRCWPTALTPLMVAQTEH
jgi:hypothetical protein